MSKSNQFESPCYFLSAEEYTQDYLSLPEPQLACLFKLRSAYALKGSPLSEDDIEGLYPVYTPVHEKTLGKVLNKFFTKKGDVFIDIMISLKYANGLRNGANSDTHRCKQLTEHGEERCIKLREVAGFSAVRTIFQIVGPRKILHCLLGK